VNNEKFTIRGGCIVHRSTGKAIPEHEPVFILRACDKQALSILRVYQSKMRPKEDCWKGIQSVIEDFTKFREENPGEMKQPIEAYEG